MDLIYKINKTKYKQLIKPRHLIAHQILKYGGKTITIFGFSIQFIHSNECPFLKSKLIGSQQKQNLDNKLFPESQISQSQRGESKTYI